MILWVFCLLFQYKEWLDKNIKDIVMYNMKRLQGILFDNGIAVSKNKSDPGLEHPVKNHKIANGIWQTSWTKTVERNALIDFNIAKYKDIIA